MSNEDYSKLAQQVFGNMPHTLERASIEYFLETGKINGSFLTRLKIFTSLVAIKNEEESDFKNSESKQGVSDSPPENGALPLVSLCNAHGKTDKITSESEHGTLASTTDLQEVCICTRISGCQIANGEYNKAFIKTNHKCKLGKS